VTWSLLEWRIAISLDFSYEIACQVFDIKLMRYFNASANILWREGIPGSLSRQKRLVDNTSSILGLGDYMAKTTSQGTLILLITEVVGDAAKRSRLASG
jgi:hypothetical protein